MTVEVLPSIDVVKDHVVPLMRSIVLLCDVKAHPTPTITWLENTLPISGSQANVQRVLDSSLLGLWAVTPRDAGQYVCWAQNAAGTAQRRYNVIVTVPGKWSAWSAWGFCNVTCGLGYQLRARRCQYIDDNDVVYDKSTNSERIVLDESECKGANIDKRKCHMPPCEEPLSSKWSAWSKWSACSSACGQGSQTRSRRCKSVQPCYGDNVQIRKCPTLPKCDASEKREVSSSTSAEVTTETDQHIPQEIYEMQPETLDEDTPPDVEVFYTKPKSASTSSRFYDVSVTSNLDFSEPGACHPGYTYNATTNSCDDIDECVIPYNQCHATQVCVNSAGGYRCGCGAGYASLGAGQRCLDVNECEQQTDGCEFACVNVAGGYVCACPRHLRLHVDNHHCVLPSAYREPYIIGDLDTGEYLSATIELPSDYKNSRS